MIFHHNRNIFLNLHYFNAKSQKWNMTPLFSKLHRFCQKKKKLISSSLNKANFAKAKKIFRCLFFFYSSRSVWIDSIRPTRYISYNVALSSKTVQNFSIFPCYKGDSVIVRIWEKNLGNQADHCLPAFPWSGRAGHAARLSSGNLIGMRSMRSMRAMQSMRSTATLALIM